MPKTIKQKLMNLITKLYIDLTGSSLRQGENVDSASEAFVPPETRRILRTAASEGAVLLKNDGTLPLVNTFALFGRTQTDTFYTGYGSGGDVIKPYRVSILEGLEGANAPLVRSLVHFYRQYQEEHPVDHGYWGNWPYSFEEAPLSEELLASVRKQTDTAVVVIGRAAGEDRENMLEEGSYYLTSAEKEMLGSVCARFPHVAVVLNVGSIPDMSWVEQYPVGAVLLVWQGGMETGNACADLLLGRSNPCGKLPDTIARSYNDYPSSGNFGNALYNEYAEDIFVGYRHFQTFAPQDVLFPFGYGLSYTSFAIGAEYKDGKIFYTVTNTGERDGKTAVELFVKKPSGRLSNPARELIAFHKTPCLPSGETFGGEFVLDARTLSSYDECKKAFMLLKGQYELFVGSDVQHADMVGTFTVEEDETIEQLSENCAPRKPFEIITANGKSHCVTARKNLKEQIFSTLPPEIPYTGERNILLSDVKAGKASVIEFVAQLNKKELEALCRGDFKMDSPLGASGNAGVMGGISESLRKKGVPAVTMTDGPSGIRLKRSCSLVPNATLLAATFDEELVARVYGVMGREMKERGSHVLLAPAMNLHRDPLCGRNFEYFSEDPYLSGKIAAAAVVGLQREGVSACPKHFACNNQEFNRNHNDSRVSERALRELYLRGFEICVKESKPHFIMTSYNKINGVWSYYNYELVRGILRGEWKFDGCVVTDWWVRSARSPDFKRIKNNAYRIRAGVNVLMPGGDFIRRGIQGGSPLKKLGKKEAFTLGEMQKNAVEVLSAIIKTSAME